MSRFGKYDSINQKKQQMINRALVIDLLRQEKLCSRADLAKLSGLKRATITYIVNEFMEYDLIVEDGFLNGKKGRRSIGIRINGEKYRTIGVMITREHYSISMMGLSGEVFLIESYAVNKTMHAEKVIEEIKEKIREMIDREKECQVLAVCVAVPGPYKKHGDRLAYVTNLFGWENIEINRCMQEGIGIPVFIENDANAGVFAQQWFRKKKKEQQNIVYIVAGQGIGCGIISNGELQRGSMGVAGEIGHTSINYKGLRCECGNYGCLETYCSSIAVMKNVKKRLNQGEPSVLNSNSNFSDFAKAVRACDPLALEEYRKACEYLAIGIINLINQINPDDIIIGDILMEINPEMMLEIIQKKVSESIPFFVQEMLTIDCNQLEYNPILIGAGAIAAQNVLENPLKYLQKIER